MTRIETVLLTGKTHTTASGRDGRVDLKLSSPGNAGGDMTFAAVQAHPTAEQLFAGAWSACYISAIGLVAKEKKVKLPSDLSVEVEVDLGKKGEAYLLQARFNVSVPGVAREVAEAIAHAAHEICPYSKATRGNIDVAVNLV
ncbi:Ohr family peroxiredoxin [Paraburkholderia lacunae]|uniref:Peroxiredoxin n=1 Tax=Paraburkholderia lacunae TaxID=2211104 RepID=A0A370N3V5_9BURK|nr:Ohr family peroxiredoxin [Paraburkholderia lacunae]RDK00299.1 peroxiredoxin [Paraburkholderia lacunae]